LTGLWATVSAAQSHRDPQLPAHSIAYQDRLASVEAELASLRARLDESGPLGEDGGCDDGGACCGDWREQARAPGWYAGFEFVFLKPHYNNNTALLHDDPGGASAATTPSEAFDLGINVASVPFDSDYELSPRLWLGYTGEEGLGLRGRYWQFEHSDDPVTFNSTLFREGFAVAGTFPLFGFAAAVGPGSQLTAFHRLDLQTFDLELTQELNWCRSQVTLGGGLRYVRNKQRYEAVGSVLNVPLDSVSFDQSFEGFGPTVALDFVRPICNSAWAIYGSGRASALFGEQRYLTTNDFLIFGASNHAQNDATRAILEMQLGLEYERELGCRTLFLRGGYEGQYWLDGGGTNVAEGDLGLHGLSIGFGLRM